jgi:hypothetical protein
MGSGGIAPAFLTSAPHVRAWSASRPGHFTPWERALGAHSIGYKVGPELVRTLWENREISFHVEESNRGRPVRSP